MQNALIVRNIKTLSKNSEYNGNFKQKILEGIQGGTSVSASEVNYIPHSMELRHGPLIHNPSQIELVNPDDEINKNSYDDNNDYLDQNPLGQTMKNANMMQMSIAINNRGYNSTGGIDGDSLVSPL